ncbi:cupin domain-containing protein [Granulicatella seriolae]|uniref:Cupin domain-containing protein n=1 Tax=Granulicatella seriolae TaxID=2967226 RepID=A0ABT1WLU5_9LACT|nr:cupin domain-containing protein [Granulicatella seriolae]
MLKTAKEWIQSLGLLAHAEGGYYKEVLKAQTNIINDSGDSRPLYTSIYFLLEHNNPSHFHRLQSDEVWYFHDGAPLTVHMIDAEGTYHSIHLGLDSDQGQVLQAVVPKGVIFGSSVEDKDTYSLVSCMVAPGFDYRDFELFDRETLIQQYPQHQEIIMQLAFETLD